MVAARKMSTKKSMLGWAPWRMAMEISARSATLSLGKTAASACQRLRSQR